MGRFEDVRRSSGEDEEVRVRMVRRIEWGSEEVRRVWRYEEIRVRRVRTVRRLE